jgi:hypothetical protein
VLPRFFRVEIFFAALVIVGLLVPASPCSDSFLYLVFVVVALVFPALLESGSDWLFSAALSVSELERARYLLAIRFHINDTLLFIASACFSTSTFNTSYSLTFRVSAVFSLYLFLASYHPHSWKSLPVEQREGIKSFLITLIIRLSSTDASLKENHAYLKRLNLRYAVSEPVQSWQQSIRRKCKSILVCTNQNKARSSVSSREALLCHSQSLCNFCPCCSCDYRRIPSQSRANPQAGLAAQLAQLHRRLGHCVQAERGVVHQQHAHSAAAQVLRAGAEVEDDWHSFERHHS